MQKKYIISAGFPFTRMVAALSLLVVACVGDPTDPLNSTDGASDTDSDADTDSDSDTDGDVDGDSDVDADTDSDNIEIVLQNGLDGYEGCEDTYLWMEEYKTLGAEAILSVQGYH